jgi:hypothetical protein
MRMLGDIADRHGVSVSLVPHWLAYEIDELESEDDATRLDLLNELRLDTAGLIGWYERLGYRTTGAMVGDDPLMRREPRVAIYAL